jgi:putative SOS response-associated peptidase YedK
MCARFNVDDAVVETVLSLTSIRNDEVQNTRRGDVRPSEKAILLCGKQDGLSVDKLQWGFVRPDGKGLVINARSESVLEKRMFRDSCLRRRCAVPACSFYEWDQAKNLVTFSDPKQPVMFLAGIYDQNRFTILTTAANSSVSRFHDRMPVLLQREELEPWIFSDKTFDRLLDKQMPELKHWQEFEQMSLF